MTLTHDDSPKQLSDGRPARVLCWDLNTIHGRVIVAATKDLEHGYEDTFYFTQTGDPLYSGGIPLIDAPKRRSVWANVYGRKVGTLSYGSRQEADNCRSEIFPALALLELIYEGDKLVQAVLHEVEQAS